MIETVKEFKVLWLAMSMLSNVSNTLGAFSVLKEKLFAVGKALFLQLHSYWASFYSLVKGVIDFFKMCIYKQDKKKRDG